MKRALFACAVLIALTATATASVERTEQLVFDIEFDGRPMGQHEFEITYRDDDRIQVESRVNMRYRIAFIPVFRYQHSASEQWRGGCLQTLASQTNDDGDRYAVQGKQQTDGFVITEEQPLAQTRRVDDPCPATFAYWQPDLLQRSALINAQTGRLQTVQVKQRDPEPLDDVPTARWTIETETDGTIELWYGAADGRWLRLEHTSERGTLVYRRKDS